MYIEEDHIIIDYTVYRSCASLLVTMIIYKKLTPLTMLVANRLIKQTCCTPVLAIVTLSWLYIVSLGFENSQKFIAWHFLALLL